jgi:hypothetical protein
LSYRLFVTGCSAFCHIGFLYSGFFAYRLFVHDCLLFVISAFCHIGFLFYRLIDIGFLTVGLFRSAFHLESSNTTQNIVVGALRPPTNKDHSIASRDTFVPTYIVLKVGFLERDFEPIIWRKKATGQKWAKKYTVQC